MMNHFSKHECESEEDIEEDSKCKKCGSNNFGATFTDNGIIKYFYCTRCREIIEK